jgi:mRNA interferase RelE/StbE
LEDQRSMGGALKASKLGALWKYRVDDYRIIASMEDGAMMVLVVRVGNRRDVYRNAIR